MTAQTPQINTDLIASIVTDAAQNCHDILAGMRGRGLDTPEAILTAEDVSETIKAAFVRNSAVASIGQNLLICAQFGVDVRDVTALFDLETLKANAQSLDDELAALSLLTDLDGGE